MSARQLVLEAAAAVGFDTIRFARVESTPHISAFDAWIAAGKHGDMHYLARGRDVRANPRERLASARTAVVLALPHHHRRPPDPGGRTGLVARYAWGRDYHNIIDKRLKKLKRALRASGMNVWGGVDTAPILERSWAGAAGLGFSGKNSMQILVGTSSWFFLAVVFINVDIPPDPPVGDHCGDCIRCLSICPTDAFDGPRDLDSTKCISYWSIEARGLPPRHLRPAFGRWFFGCDLCQEVCPHNHDPPIPDCDDLLPRNAWIDLDEILATPDDVLLERFIGTPLRRPKGHGLKRNAAIVLGNLGDDGGVDSLREHGLTHPEPVVRGASVWALQRLGAPPDLTDPDPLVAAELRAGRRAGDL